MTEKLEQHKTDSAMIGKPEVLLKPNSYQPGRKEMLEDVSIGATPDELAEAVLRPVKIVREDHPQLNKYDRD